MEMFASVDTQSSLEPHSAFREISENSGVELS